MKLSPLLLNLKIRHFNHETAEKLLNEKNAQHSRQETVFHYSNCQLLMLYCFINLATAPFTFTKYMPL